MHGGADGGRFDQEFARSYDAFVQDLSNGPTVQPIRAPPPRAALFYENADLPQKRARTAMPAAFRLQEGDDDVSRAKQMIEDGLQKRRSSSGPPPRSPGGDAVDPNDPYSPSPAFNVRSILKTNMYLSLEDILKNYTDGNSARKNAVPPPTEEEKARTSAFYEKPVRLEVPGASESVQELESAMKELSIESINKIQRAISSHSNMPSQKKYDRVLQHGYSEVFDSIRGYTDYAREAFTRRMTVRTRLEIAREPKVSYQGDLRFAKLLRMPAEIASRRGVKLEEIQMGFIREFTFACAPLVYREDWDVCKVSFFMKYNVKRIFQQVLAIAPRRFGKTWALGIFVLALLLTCEGIVVCVFAQNERAARAIVDITRTFLFYMPHGRERLANDAAGEIHILPESALKTCTTKNEKRHHPRLSKMIALPASVNSAKRHTKGAGKQCVCVCYTVARDTGEAE